MNDTVIGAYMYKDPTSGRWLFNGLMSLGNKSSGSVVLYCNIPALASGNDFGLVNEVGSIGKDLGHRFNAKWIKRGFFHTKVLLRDTLTQNILEAEFANRIGDIIRDFHSMEISNKSD
ncbi:MAG: hypothetical protein WC378_04305 [Opitutaceae bacterium]|jgi:hypothetical protein